MSRLFHIATVAIALAVCADAGAQVVYRVNAGGPDFVDPAGNLWRSDSAVGFFNTGQSFAVDSSVEIEETDLDPLYRSHRFDGNSANPDMSYSYPVAPGFYSVRLHFAEIYWNSPGRRRFDVLVEGQPVLVDYDILGLTGGKNVADVQQFVTEVMPGDATLDIRFAHGSIDHPLICAFEIEAIPPSPIITNGDGEMLRVEKNSNCLDAANLLSLNAVDPDTDEALLTWRLIESPTVGTVTFLGGNQSGSNVFVCYTPAADQVIPDAFAIDVSDGDPGSDADRIDILVWMVDTEAPTISCPTDATVEANDGITPSETGRATAVDDFGAAPIVSFNDTVAAGTCPSAVVVQRTWTARDAAGNSQSCTQRIFIRDADSDGDGSVDCQDDDPDDPNVGGTNGGNGNSNNGGGNNNGGNNTGGDQNGNDLGGGVSVDPMTGQPIPENACCGGGAPALMPLMLYGLRRRRRRAKR